MGIINGIGLPRRIARLVIFSGILLTILLVYYLSSAKTARPVFVPSSFDWSTVQQHHGVKDIKPLPAGKPNALPRIQAQASDFSHSAKNEKRRDAVRGAFKRSYDAYKKHAWMRDELTPVSGSAKDPFGGWAATLVDALDTLWIMGFEDEFAEAAGAVGALDWSVTDSTAANMFETTIRHLGGLLSAYDLSGEQVLLRKALELGEMLYMGFDTPNRLPGFWLDFDKAKSGKLVAGTNDPSASPCSLSMEFTRLSQLTGDSKYYDATDRVTRFLERIQNDTMLPGMWPTTLNFQAELAADSSFTLGALADSLYEYLPKMHALLGGVDEVYEKLYRRAMDAAVQNLLFRPMVPDHDDILFSGEFRAGKVSGSLETDSQHLTCFVGGMFALGGKLFRIDHHVDIGERLARGCGWAYSRFPTGIMPEIFGMVPCKTLETCVWDEERWEKAGGKSLPKGFTHARDKRYILRPEAIESLFVLYRVTAKPDLQDTAWDMFEAIMKATETELANSAIEDVTVSGPTKKLDSMESFWLAETLKYFYLIFSPPDVISLDEYVLNTEAHPLKRPRSCSNWLNVTYPAPVAASGWQYRLIANGFTRPRGIAFDNEGGLLVVESGVGLRHLALNDEGGTCLTVASSKALIADRNLNHGLALSGDGKTLYVSSASSVFSFAYDSQAISVDLSSNLTLVANMSNSDHTTRTLLVSRKQPDTLVVSRGSNANEDPDAADVASGHSQIRSYNITESSLGDAPFDFLDGHLVGWGLRNSVGVAEHPSSGGIWSVENSVDELQRRGRDIHQDNPGEELNYHGVLGSGDHQGGNYGYPFCYAVWSTSDFPGLGDLEVGDQFADDGAPSALKDADCNADYVPPRLAFQAHSAPLDIKFAPNASEAFVSFHGSWDRDDPTGYRIVSLAFGPDGQPTALQNTTDAVADIITNAHLSNCPDRCFRPVSLAWDSAGRLWFSSDTTREIFVLERTNRTTGTGGGSSSANDGNAANGLISERPGAVAVAQAAVLAGLLLA
ncbi:glycoside hydrolase [Trichoderma ceciliae]